MKPHIILIVLALSLGSCAIFGGERVTRLKVDNDDLLDARITGPMSMYAFQLKGGALDSFMVQIFLNEHSASPEHFDAHVIHPKHAGFCNPWNQEKWTKTEVKDTKTNSVKMNCTFYMQCGEKKYEINASYEGKLSPEPQQVPD